MSIITSTLIQRRKREAIRILEELVDCNTLEAKERRFKEAEYLLKRAALEQERIDSRNLQVRELPNGELVIQY